VYKTFSAAVLAKLIHETACVRVGWCDVPVTLFQLERKRFQPQTDLQIDRWKQVPWLVIDDFAMVQVGSWQHGVLCEIAMHRFSQGKPTCWTGNIQFPRGQQHALVDAVGAQLARRVMEGSEGYRLAIAL
jgi:DNA replication protein DnaC